MTYLRSGIFMAPFHNLAENPVLALERDMELLQHLDMLNYDEAWVGEHHSGGFEIIASPEDVHRGGGRTDEAHSSRHRAWCHCRTTIHSSWRTGWCNWITRPAGGRCSASAPGRWCTTRRRSASSRPISGA